MRTEQRQPEPLQGRRPRAPRRGHRASPEQAEACGECRPPPDRARRAIHKEGPGAPARRAASPDAADPGRQDRHTEGARDSPEGSTGTQKRGHNLVPGGRGPREIRQAPACPESCGPAGAAPSSPRSRPEEGQNRRRPNKRTSRSAAQKRASSRHGIGPMPATNAVPGAFGKEPSAASAPERK